MADKTKYIMFLDESGDHSLAKVDPQFPLFSLAGCIFEQDYYYNVAIPLVNELKEKYWQNIGVILHSREIRKREGSFNILMNAEIRQAFYESINNLVSTLEFTVISSVVNKTHLKISYDDPISPYDLTLMFIMERFCHFLRKNKGVGKLVAESRGSQPDNDLFSYYSKYYNHGTYYRSASEFQHHLLGISFLSKKENEAGLQISDLVAYPLANQAAGRNNTQQSYAIIEPKLYDGYCGKISSFGFKVFPW